MSYKQLIQPNLATAGNVGRCLAFVESAFNTPHLYPNAKTAWDQAVYKHTDQNFPADVAVLLWWSFIENGEDLGHVAINVPGKGILSSPWKLGTAQAWLSSKEELENIYSNGGQHPLIFLGWTEDVAGVRVVEPVVDAPPYQIVENYPNGKQVKLNKQPTYLWGMNYTDFNYMANHPVETHNLGEIVTVTNKVHHQDGYDYYRRDGQIDGFNVADCDDYTPPPPPPPAAPVTAPLAQKYEIVTTLMYFGNSQDAQFKKNALGTLSPKVYYKFEATDITVQLGDDNMHAKYWVNVKDNVAMETVKDIKPAAYIVSNPPDDWKQTYQQFSDHKTRRYVFQQDMRVLDFANPSAPGIDIKAGEHIPMWGYFQINGHEHLRPIRTDAQGNQMIEEYLGVPVDNLYTGLPMLRSEAYLADIRKAADEARVYRKSVHHETTDDRIFYAEQLIARFVKDGGRVLSGIIPLNKLKAMYSQKDNKKL